MTGIIVYLVLEVVIHWNDVSALKIQFDLWSVFSAALFGVLAYQALFLGWLTILWRTGVFDCLQLKLYFRVWWIAYLFRYLPGKIFLLIERVRLGSMVGIPKVMGASIVFIETVIAGCAAAWVSLLAFSYYVVNLQWTVIGVCLISLGAFLLLPTVIRFLCSLEIIQEKFPEAEPFTFSWRDSLLVAPVFLMHFVFSGVSFFLCLNLVWELSWTAFPGICGVYALSYLVGMVVMIAPGGLGVREGTLALQLGRILPDGLAVTVAIGARLWFVALELLSFGLVILLTPSFPQKSNLEVRSK